MKKSPRGHKAVRISGVKDKALVVISGVVPTRYNGTYTAVVKKATKARPKVVPALAAPSEPYVEPPKESWVHKRPVRARPLTDLFLRAALSDGGTIRFNGVAR